MKPNGQIKLTTFSKVVRRLIQLFTSLGILPNGGASHKLASLLFRWTLNEGKHGVDRFKSLSNFLSRSLLGIEAVMPPHKIRRPFWSIYKYGKSGKLQLLFALSVLQLHRLVRLKPSRDVSSITSIFTGSWLSFIWNFGYSMWNFNPSSLGGFSLPEFKLNWFLSAKSGPNGSPAWKLFHSDISAILVDDLVSKNLLYLFKHLPVRNRGEVITQASDLLTNIGEILYSWKGKFIHSRLSFLSDKAGKTRVVAIGDILSQSLLKPIHDHLFTILRKLPQDGTFNQDAQRQRVKTVTSSGKKIFCFDLTAATDRFPVILITWALYQCRVLGFEQALAWSRVIADRSFTTPEGQIRYSVGQPMGFLSSWGSFALAHHYVVQLCAIKSYGNITFQDYALLGDDIAIWDDKVAENYLLLMKCLGVEISTSKSVIGIGVAEFAKVLFVKGKYFKPVSPDLMNPSWDDMESNCASLSRELALLGLSLDLHDYLGIYPSEKRVGLQRILLSPLNPTRSVFTGIPPVHPDRGWALEAWLLSEKIRVLSQEKLKDKMRTFNSTDSTGLSLGGYFTPFVQITHTILFSYPVRVYREEAIFPDILVGPDWIAWDPDAWDSYPHVKSQQGIPERENINRPLREDRKKLSRFDALLPHYLWPSCNLKSFKGGK